MTQDPRSLTSGTNGDLSFGGIRGFQNSFLVGGGDYNNAFFAQALGRYRAPYQFSTEVVQEFRVSSNSYGAELGRSGSAVVNVTTKSGSNHAHGREFYYLRDSSFGAADPFLAFKPHNRQQQASWKLGSDGLLTWIHDFFPSQQSGEFLFYPIKVDPLTYEPMEGGLQLTPLRAYAHEVPHYYLQNLGSATSHPDTNEYAAFA